MKEHGVWVFYGGKPLSASVTDRLLLRIREERDLANIGKNAFGLRQEEARKNEPRQTPLAGTGRKSWR